VSLRLGIDLGTTGVRAAAFDPSGRLVVDASEACPHEAPQPGWAEADPERWWHAVKTVCARVLAKVRPHEIAAVGVTGQAPTAVLLDGEGRAVRPAILWLDVRASAEARALDAALGEGVAEALGGNRMHAYFLGPKLAWLRAHEPQALDRAALVLQSHAFVALRLTGEAACDPSTAMLCAPLFDARAGAWSQAAAAAVGLKMASLPRIARAHDVVGSVTRAAEAATGLREGTPVVAGGGDFAASALGAGVSREGEACLMLGTAGNVLLPMNEPRFDSRLINSHHVGSDAWLALGGTLCGAALEWFRRACAPGVPWEALEAEAASIQVGAEGVVMLPYLQGERTPVWDEAARGAFFGLGLTHGRGHLVRALFEGIALGFADCLAVARQAGTHVEEAIAANGAGKSPLLRQTLADAMGIPVTWSNDHGATVWGAALLAGLGVGNLATMRRTREGQDGVPSHRHMPDPRAHDHLLRVMERRTALYGAERGSRVS
jgi:xylulokinase